MSQNLEFRKVQFSGRTSYMLALPKKWAEEMGLRQGEKVVISKQGTNSLVIRSGKSYPSSASAASNESDIFSNNNNPNSDDNEIQLIVGKDEFEFAIRKVISLYVAGYSRIHLVGAGGGKLTPNLRNAIKSAVWKRLLGTEVIDDSADGISLQVLLSQHQLNAKNALKRMSLIAVSMHKNAMESLSRSNSELVKSVEESIDEVDRFNFFITRQLEIAQRGSGYIGVAGPDEQLELFQYKVVSKLVEKSAREALRIVQGTKQMTDSLDEQMALKIEARSISASSIFAEALVCLFERDYKATGDIAKNIKQALSELDRESWSILAEARNHVANSSNGSKRRSDPLMVSVMLAMESIRSLLVSSDEIIEIVLTMNTQNAGIQRKRDGEGMPSAEKTAQDVMDKLEGKLEASELDSQALTTVSR